MGNQALASATSKSRNVMMPARLAITTAMRATTDWIARRRKFIEKPAPETQYLLMTVMAMDEPQ